MSASFRLIGKPQVENFCLANRSLTGHGPYRCTDCGQIWHRAKFHPHRCNVSPIRGKKPQNRPLRSLNTGVLRCALWCL